MIVYPHTTSIVGSGKMNSESYSNELVHIIPHSSISSGKMCRKAIAMKTPEAKELAIPSTLGLSRHDFETVGQIPVR